MVAFVAVAAMIGALASGCAGPSDASRSLSFDSTSKKAIVIVGTSVNKAQQEEVRAGRSLSTFWQEYDPDTRRLLPGGRTFLTKVGASVFSEPEYLRPTVAVLEVDPGDYALIGAGFPHLMTTYVRSSDHPSQTDHMGRRESWTHTVDPRMHIDPAADVDPLLNFLFSVLPGQILYIGHFEFRKSTYLDSLSSINYFQDEAAARKALEDFPGIAGVMITVMPGQLPQSVAR
jgi:hypothetical protein